jgi:hypothetical protein
MKPASTNIKGNPLTEALGIEGVTGINCLDCLIANSSRLCVLTDNYKYKKNVFLNQPKELIMSLKWLRQLVQLPGEQ